MPFQCVVREIVQDITGGPWNTRKGIPYSIFSFRDATLLPVIQEAAEAYLVELFKDTNLYVRVTRVLFATFFFVIAIATATSPKKVITTATATTSQKSNRYYYRYFGEVTSLLFRYF